MIDLAGMKKLSGTIPATIKNCAWLEEVVVGRGGVAGYYGSKVSGTLPENMGEIYGLKDLNVGCNIKLSGTLPISLGNLRRLRTVNVGGAFKMTGNLPGDFGFLTGLQTLMTLHTKINGPLPTVEGGLGQLSLCSIGTMPGATVDTYERSGLTNPSGSCKMPWESECLGETEGNKGDSLRDACDTVRSNALGSLKWVSTAPLYDTVPVGTCAGGAGSECTGLNNQPTIAATCTNTKDSTGSAACVWTQTVAGIGFSANGHILGDSTTTCKNPLNKDEDVNFGTGTRNDKKTCGVGSRKVACCADGGEFSSAEQICYLGTDTALCGTRYRCPKGSYGVANLLGGLTRCSVLLNYAGPCLKCPRGKFKDKGTRPPVCLRV